MAYDKDKLDDFSFNVSSAIPENELLDFAYDTNDDPSSILLNQYDNNINNNSNYFSPAASPYAHNNNNSNVGSHNAAYQPQSIQQSLSQSLRRHSSLSGSANTRNNSIYDTLESVASPAGTLTSHNNNNNNSNNNNRLNPAYFSPVAKSIPLHNNHDSNNANNHNNNNANNNININNITSPDSYNDMLSPYSSFDPSSFKSPRSIGASPIPSGSFNGSSSLPKQSLTKEDKLRRRREFHNQVERRRRDLIKEKIKELGLIVPPTLLYVDEEGREMKASKNVIINKTVDYMAHLHKVMKEQESRREKLLAKIEELTLITGGVSSGNSASTTPQPSQPPAPALASAHASAHASAPLPQTSAQTPQTSQASQAFTQSPQVQSQIQPHTQPLGGQVHEVVHDWTTEFTPDLNLNLDEGFALSSIKLEDQQNLEFDVDEFLKEHNETWDHSK
jgi:hypothetical protein